MKRKIPSDDNLQFSKGDLPKYSAIGLVFKCEKWSNQSTFIYKIENKTDAITVQRTKNLTRAVYTFLQLKNK